MSEKRPLVSIMIPNYNHGLYLDECIQSAINQTYENIEIIVVDNSSADDSVQIAGKYSSNRIRICRNPYNVLNNSYKILAELANGKYMLLLCADDVIDKMFVEKAISIMESNPNVGYVHGERDFVTDAGEILELDPFFRCSFIAPGQNVMPLYMVTTIAHPSQGIFRSETFRMMGGYDMEIDHMNADRMLWYYLSYESDYAYIREKMCKIRVGNQTETLVTQRNFQHPILCHLTIKEMVRFAKQKNLEKVVAREAEALRRLSREFLNYAAGMLAIDDRISVGRYLEYARVLFHEITEEPVFQKLSDMQQGAADIDLDYLRTINKAALQKARNYQPPEGFMIIQERA